MANKVVLQSTNQKNSLKSRNKFLRAERNFDRYLLRFFTVGVSSVTPGSSTIISSPPSPPFSCLCPSAASMEVLDKSTVTRLPFAAAIGLVMKRLLVLLASVLQDSLSELKSVVSSPVLSSSSLSSSQKLDSATSAVLWGYLPLPPSSSPPSSCWAACRAISSMASWSISLLFRFLQERRLHTLKKKFDYFVSLFDSQCLGQEEGSDQRNDKEEEVDNGRDWVRKLTKVGVQEWI